VAIDAVRNPHIAPAPQVETKSPAKPGRLPELAPVSVESEGAEQPSAPLTIINQSVSQPPAPLSIINESVKPRKLISPPVEEEHLAPIIPSSAAKRRPLPKPATNRDARLPSPYPATTRPIDTTIPDHRPAAQTAATEDASGSHSSSSTAGG
jgi:hypothetical protein